VKNILVITLAVVLALSGAIALAGGSQDIASDASVFTWGGHDSVDDRPVTSGTRNLIGDEIASRVDVRAIPFGWGHNVQDQEKTSLMIAADEHPEAHAYWQGGAQRTWFINGAYRSIPIAMVREHAPNFAASMDAIGEGSWVAMAAPGDPDSIWAFPKMQATHYSATRVGGNARYDWIIATDMADKMNIPIDERSTQDSPRGVLDAEQRIPNTFFYTYQTAPLSLVEEFLRKVVDLDPLGGGRTLGYVPQGDKRNMCGWQGAGHICMALGMNDQRFSIMEGDDGETINLISPAARRALAKIQDWFQQGLIDPEYITNDFATFRAKLAAGLGAMSGRGTTSCNPESETGDTYCGAWLDDNTVKMVSFDALTDEDGTFIRAADSFGPLPMIVDGEVTVLRHDMSDEKLISFLKYYDYVAHTCEGQTLARYGIEGTHWTADQDACEDGGGAVKLFPNPGTMIDTTLVGGGLGIGVGAKEDPNFEIGLGFFNFDTAPMELFRGYNLPDPGQQEWWSEWRGVGGAGVQPLDKPYKFDLFGETDALDKQTEFVGQLRAISDEYFYSTIASGDSIDATWDDYVETMLDAGGQAILDEYAKLDYTTEDLQAGRVSR